MEDPAQYDINTTAVRELDEPCPHRSHLSRACSRLKIWLVPLALLALISLAVAKMKPETREISSAIKETAEVSFPSLSGPAAMDAPLAEVVVPEPAEPAPVAPVAREEEVLVEALPEKLESQIGEASGGDGSYHILVASLRSQERAEALAARLVKQGHEAEHQAVGGPRHGWWHTVRTGPYETRIEAEIARLELDRQYRLDAFVVPRAKGPYHVQVSSLRLPKKADKLVKRLRRQGHVARRHDVRVSGKGIWHAIRIGPFDTRNEANAYRRHFKKHAGMSAVVVPFEHKPR